jgi:hypothetical protein
LLTTFFNGDIDFNTPELNQFISHTPTFGAYDEARLIFGRRAALVRLHPSLSDPLNDRRAEVKILRQVSDWQLSSLAQICTLSLHLLLTMENLYIHEDLNSPPNWRDDIENTEWLDLLLPFTAVKNRSVARSAKCSLGGVPSHRNLSRKALRSSFLRDSSPIALSPFRYGRET